MGLFLNETKNRIKEIILCSMANATVMSFLQSKRKVGMNSFYSTKDSKQFHPHYSFNKTVTFIVCPDKENVALLKVCLYQAKWYLTRSRGRT